MLMAIFGSDMNGRLSAKMKHLKIVLMRRQEGPVGVKVSAPSPWPAIQRTALADPRGVTFDVPGNPSQ